MANDYKKGQQEGTQDKQGKQVHGERERKESERMPHQSPKYGEGQGKQYRGDEENEEREGSSERNRQAKQ